MGILSLELSFKHLGLQKREALTLEGWLVKFHNHLPTHLTEFSQFSKKFFLHHGESNFVNSLIPFDYQSSGNSALGEVIERGFPKEGFSPTSSSAP